MVKPFLAVELLFVLFHPLFPFRVVLYFQDRVRRFFFLRCGQVGSAIAFFPSPPGMPLFDKSIHQRRLETALPSPRVSFFDSLLT